jgi:hypothetical protein
MSFDEKYYKEKYLKYKSKYVHLKNGGSQSDLRVCDGSIVYEAEVRPKLNQLVIKFPKTAKFLLTHLKIKIINNEIPLTQIKEFLKSFDEVFSRLVSNNISNKSEEYSNKIKKLADENKKNVSSILNDIDCVYKSKSKSTGFFPFNSNSTIQIQIPIKDLPEKLVELINSIS